jgi:hypothetical protein
MGILFRCQHHQLFLLLLIGYQLLVILISCEMHSKFFWIGKGVGDVDLFDWHITYKHFNMDTLQIEDYVTFPLV